MEPAEPRGVCSLPRSVGPCGWWCTVVLSRVCQYRIFRQTSVCYSGLSFPWGGRKPLLTSQRHLLVPHVSDQNQQGSLFEGLGENRDWDSSFQRNSCGFLGKDTLDFLINILKTLITILLSIVRATNSTGTISDTLLWLHLHLSGHSVLFMHEGYSTPSGSRVAGCHSISRQ